MIAVAERRHAGKHFVPWLGVDDLIMGARAGKVRSTASDDSPVRFDGA